MVMGLANFYNLMDQVDVNECYVGGWAWFVTRPLSCSPFSKKQFLDTN